MHSRVAVGVGLLGGAVLATLAIVAILLAAPPPSAVGPTPTPGSSADGSPAASPDPSGSADPSASGPAGSPTPRPTIIATGFHIGEPAPALVVPQVGGGTIDLASLKGKAVWLNFMATWCPSCQDEFPLMNGFAARYAADGLVVIAVDVREEEGDVAAFARSLSVVFPMGLDTSGAVQQAWEAYVLPMHFWIDADGVVRDGAFGGIGPDVMAEALRTILPGVEITT